MQMSDYMRGGISSALKPASALPLGKVCIFPSVSFSERVRFIDKFLLQRRNLSYHKRDKTFLRIFNIAMGDEKRFR